MTNQQQHQQTAGRTSSDNAADDGYVSKVSVLPSSLPFYHNQIMDERKKRQSEATAAATAVEDEGEPMSATEAAYFAKLSVGTGHRELSSEEQAANARHLKPHSRSTIQLQRITADAAERAEALNQTSNKKKGANRWQYGIRSRNQPLDAVHCIYKALRKQRAEWHVSPPQSEHKDTGPYPVNVSGATHLSSTDSNLSESPEKGRVYQRNHDDEAASDHGFGGDGAASSTDKAKKPISKARGKDVHDEDIDPHIFPPDYLPDDPWVIHVRWLADNLHPHGIAHPGSANSSRLDLSTDDATRRRTSVGGSLSSSKTGSAASFTAPITPIPSSQQPKDACYVYADIQLYTMEPDTYLVDFKCSGYESVIKEYVNDLETKILGTGVRVVDKDVTSPQPFLDLANKLVIQLAKG